MEKKTAVITGFGGFGQALAKIFLEQDWRVFILSKTQKDLDGAEFIECDVTNPEQVVAAFAHLKKSAGRLDAVIHTAIAPIILKKISEMSEAEFKDGFNVDVFGGFSVFKQAAAIMKEQKSGSIIGLTTAYVEPGVRHPDLPSYISSKFALRGLLRELAVELMPFGVRVNALAPGFTHTGLNAGVPKRMVEFMAEKNPMGSVVTAEDVANAALFLCSGQARAITGLHIPVAYGESITL